MSTATARKKKAKPRYFRGVGQQVVTFGEERIVQTKGRWAGKPLHAEKWERELLDELYLLDEEGRRVYREALIGIARKNGKSTLSAMIALHGLIATGEEGPEVYCAAASKDQARIVFQQAREFVEASPKLREWLNPMRNAIVCAANNGVFRVLASDAPLQHGLNPSLVVIDELHAHADPELYYALTTGTLARIDPLIVSITTAGYDRETICWDVYQRGQALAARGKEAMREAGFLHVWHAAPEDAKVTDKRQWQKANPSSWITNRVLEREFNRLPEAIFRRLHLNQWTEAEDAWILPDEFDACVGKPKLELSQETWFGIDVGITRDASAIAWVQWRTEDGQPVYRTCPQCKGSGLTETEPRPVICEKCDATGKVGDPDESDKLHVRHDIRIPRSGKPLSAMENRVRLKKLAGRFEGLKDVAYDPYSFRESAEMLAEEGMPMVEYNQTNSNMCPASERLYELVREGRMVHDGDPTFRRQVLAAVASDTERGWRISKRKSRERIDAVIALLMACDRAILSRIEPEDKLNPRDFRITTL